MKTVNSYNKVTWMWLSVYIILIGYRRIMLWGIALFPLWYGLMGLSIHPTGRPTDEFAHDNMGILLLIGIIWFPLCFWSGLKFEKFINKKIK